MAENFSAFDYKTQEEVLTVLKYLTSILSTSGMQLVEILSPAHLLKQLHEPLQPETNVCPPMLSQSQTTNPVLGRPLFLILPLSPRKVGILTNVPFEHFILQNYRILGACAVDSKFRHYCYHYASEGLPENLVWYKRRVGSFLHVSFSTALTSCKEMFKMGHW